MNWSVCQKEMDGEMVDSPSTDPLFALLLPISNLCPVRRSEKRKFKRTRDSDPECDHCRHPRSEHPSRHGRIRLCPVVYGARSDGNVFARRKRSYDARRAEPCDRCCRPRSEHLSGAEEFQRRMELAEDDIDRRLHDVRRRRQLLDGSFAVRVADAAW